VSASRRTLVLPAIATAVVAAAVIAALVVLGAPSMQRQRKMDGVRVRDLTTIASFVNGYFTRHKTLPPDLATLAKEPGYRVAQSDPETGKPYDYQILDTTSYRLCADFATDSASESSDVYAIYPNVNWAHAQGHHCFDRNTGKTQ
jgi:type II secretory pathway pseudopilin PulG